MFIYYADIFLMNVIKFNTQSYVYNLNTFQIVMVNVFRNDVYI